MVDYNSTYSVDAGQAPGDGYGFLESVLSAIDDFELMELLRDYRWTGRQGYTPASMWRAVLVKYLLRLRYTRDLLRQLAASRELRELCGFENTVPDESTFSRFFKRLTEHQVLVNKILASVVDHIGDALDSLKEKGALPVKAPKLGRIVAIDSTDIEAHANPKKKVVADPDAKWGVRTAKNKIDKKEYFFGYKMHLICDAYYWTPLSYQILPANANDSPQFIELFKQLAQEHPQLRVKYTLADRGYDALPNYQHLDNQKILSVIHMRDMDKDGLYTIRGRPKCVGGEAMQYVRTDQGKGHLFRCPAEGCDMKGKSPWLGENCVFEHYENWQGDLLRKVGRLPRASKRWRRLYKSRTVIERLFSSMKRSRLLDEHSYLGIKKIQLHASLSMLTYAATMLGRLLVGDYEGMREMRIQMPVLGWVGEALAA